MSHQHGDGHHGAGTEHLEIHGRDIPLRPYNYRVMDDQIKGGAFLILGAMAGSPPRIHGCREEHQTVLIVMRHPSRLGPISSSRQPGIIIIMVIKARKPKAADITAGPYPSLSTNLQPQLMTLLLLSRGVSRTHETVVERRFNQG